MEDVFEEDVSEEYVSKLDAFEEVFSEEYTSVPINSFVVPSYPTVQLQDIVVLPLFACP